MSLVFRVARRVLPLALGIALFSACGPSNNNNAYFYDALRDTLSPNMVLNTPADNAQYDYTEDIHFVGVASDLEVKNKGGKLKSLVLVVNQTDQNNQSIIKELMQKSIPVDGKEGYTLNEKMVINSGVGTTYCQAKATVTDYSGRTFTDSVSFSVK